MHIDVQRVKKELTNPFGAVNDDYTHIENMTVTVGRSLETYIVSVDHMIRHQEGIHKSILRCSLLLHGHSIDLR